MNQKHHETTQEDARSLNRLISSQFPCYRNSPWLIYSCQDPPFYLSFTFVPARNPDIFFFSGSLLWRSCEVRAGVGHQLQPTHEAPDWTDRAAPRYVHARCEPHSLNHPQMKNKQQACKVGWGRIGSHIYHENTLNVKLHAHLSPPIVVSECNCDSPSQHVTFAYIHHQEMGGYEKET